MNSALVTNRMHSHLEIECTRSGRMKEKAAASPRVLCHRKSRLTIDYEMTPNMPFTSSCTSSATSSPSSSFSPSSSSSLLPVVDTSRTQCTSSGPGRPPASASHGLESNCSRSRLPTSTPSSFKRSFTSSSSSSSTSSSFSSSSSSSHSSVFCLRSLINPNLVSPLLTLMLLALGAVRIAEACSSRSTPKPRPASPTSRPNITFQTYACPEAYAKWYCLNGATCFSVRIGESILYNCECAEGFIGQRCEFKDLAGSYTARDRLSIERAGVFGGAAVVLVFAVVFVTILIKNRSRHRTDVEGAT